MLIGWSRIYDRTHFIVRDNYMLDIQHTGDFHMYIRNSWLQGGKMMQSSNCCLFPDIKMARGVVTCLRLT